MSETANLVFKPDGTCAGLYTEMIDLSQLGLLRVKRVSNIVFDNDKHVWRVKDKRGFPLFTAPTRQQCLEWEQQYFNNKLERGLYERTHKQNKDQKLHPGVCDENPGTQVHAGCSICV